MRSRLLVFVVATVTAVAAVACQRKQRGPEGRSRAVGTLVLDGLAADDAAGWGTEAKILVSRAAILDVVERLRRSGTELDPELLRRAATARRVPDSRILEVSVRLDDAAVAAATCNMLLEAYLDRRLTRARAGADLRQKQLVELRAARNGDAGLDPVAEELYRTTLGRLAEAQLASRTTQRDGYLLDPCVVARPTRTRGSQGRW
ncbi:MAG: hypothetical protein IT370_13910 [Deltaproteobacteria bacterium]|nr:hypothetical protein [Deltaproteobacteria bacterium]